MKLPQSYQKHLFYVIVSDCCMPWLLRIISVIIIQPPVILSHWPNLGGANKTAIQINEVFKTLCKINSVEKSERIIVSFAIIILF